MSNIFDEPTARGSLLKRKADKIADYVNSDAGIRAYARPRHDFPLKRPKIPPVLAAQISSLQFNSDHQVPPGTKLLRPSGWAAMQWQPAAPLAAPAAPAAGTIFFSALADAPANVYAKPEWVLAPARNHPISHTKNLQLTVQPSFQVNVVPANAAAGFNITGVIGVTTAWPFLAFNLALGAAQNVGALVGGVFQPGAITSVQALPNRVLHINWNWQIAWWLVINGNFVPCGASGPHEVLQTFGIPGGQLVVGNQDFAFPPPPPLGPVVVGPGVVGLDVTYERLRFAVQAISQQRLLMIGFNDNVERDHVDALFLALSLPFAAGGFQVQYNLGYNWVPPPHLNNTFLRNFALAAMGLDGRPTPSHYLWMCAANEARGECHVIAAALGVVCRIVGVQGNLEVGRLWPWPRRSDNPAGGFPARVGDPQPAAPLNPAYNAALALPLQPYLKGRYSVNDANQNKRSLLRTPYVPGLPYWKCLFLDTTYRGNNFEGVLRYGATTLYAIGEVILDIEANSDLNATIYYAQRAGGFAPANIQNTGWVFPFWPNVPPPGPLFFADSMFNLTDLTPYPAGVGVSALGHLWSDFSWQD